LGIRSAMALRHRRPLTVDVIRVCPGSVPTVATPNADMGSIVGMLVDVRCEPDLAAFARNSVLQESVGDWVVFVDETVELGRRWAERLQRDLEAVHGIDLVACSLAATHSHTGRALVNPGVDVAYRRAVLDECGPFESPTVPGWSTDLELQLRLTARGHVVQRGERTSR
jgi:hypothetical protein